MFLMYTKILVCAPLNLISIYIYIYLENVKHIFVKIYKSTQKKDSDVCLKCRMCTIKNEEE